MIVIVFSVFDCIYAILDSIRNHVLRQHFWRTELTPNRLQQTTQKRSTTASDHVTLIIRDWLPKSSLKLSLPLNTQLRKQQQIHLTASTLYWRHFNHSEKSFYSRILLTFCISQTLLDLLQVRYISTPFDSARWFKLSQHWIEVLLIWKLWSAYYLLSLDRSYTYHSFTSTFAKGRYSCILLCKTKVVAFNSLLFLLKWRWTVRGTGIFSDISWLSSITRSRDTVLTGQYVRLLLAQMPQQYVPPEPLLSCIRETRVREGTSHQRVLAVQRLTSLHSPLVFGLPDCARAILCEISES